MIIRGLRLRSFRNFPELDLAPGEGINVLVGENAQGKSNLLEAVYLLATTRSLRAGRESEMIRTNAESGMVTAELLREKEGDAELEVTIFQTDKKNVRVNGVRKQRVID